METKICKTCGRELPLEAFRKDKHGYLGRKANCKECMSKKEKQTRKFELTCKSCGEKFIATSKQAKYCAKCKNKEQGKKISGHNHPNYNGGKVVKCDNCGKEIHMTLFEYENHEHHFCSRECYGKWKSTQMQGENNPSYKPELTDEYRQQYKEDKRVGSEMDKWRKAVYERDNYTCQCCGSKKSGNGNLNAHHKDGYHWCIERRHDVTNGVTLCIECHNEFHSIYGNRNNTEEQYEEFINNKNQEKVG